MNQQDHDKRSLELHILVSQKIKEDNLLWDKAVKLLAKWQITVCPQTASTLIEWKNIMDRGQETCFEFMTSKTEKADRLRQSSPFSCLLTSKERFTFIKQWKLKNEQHKLCELKLSNYNNKNSAIDLHDLISLALNNEYLRDGLLKDFINNTYSNLYSLFSHLFSIYKNDNLDGIIYDLRDLELTYNLINKDDDNDFILGSSPPTPLIGLPQNTRYITGTSALNIPTPDGRQPDWHAHGMWESCHFSQNNKSVKAPIEILGDKGLRDITHIFKQRGYMRKDNQPIYCASPERAICDLAYSLVSQGKVIYFTIDDFLVEEFDMDELKSYLDLLKKAIPSEMYDLIEQALTPKS